MASQDERYQRWDLAEPQVRSELVSFIQSQADLSQIARLASICLYSGHVEVAGENGVFSFVYCNGRRVKTGKERGE